MKKKHTKKTEVKKQEERNHKLWTEKSAEKWGNEKCEICGGKFSCFHHFIRKSRSTLLRYDIENAIPVCAKCHYKIHFGEPIDEHRIYAQIEQVRGKKWTKYIRDREHITIKKNILWLKEQEKSLIGD